MAGRVKALLDTSVLICPRILRSDEGETRLLGEFDQALGLRLMRAIR
ncbi:MAG: hypothetical protein M3Y17_10405 [Actinomycetota bacterium]|nr:hypothetical protein [Actinomycetota bacterium]